MHYKKENASLRQYSNPELQIIFLSKEACIQLSHHFVWKRQKMLSDSINIMSMYDCWLQWETAHPPLPKANINTYFSYLLRAKCWLRGGVGGKFPRSIYWFSCVHVLKLDFIHLENNSISFFSSGHHIWPLAQWKFCLTYPGRYF